MKRIATVGLVALAAIIAYLLAWPIQLDPAPWQPPAAPQAAGALAANDALASALRVELESGHGPEDVALDDQGRVYGGLEDGRIFRYAAGVFEWFHDTGGRPLGLAFDGAGNLIVADAVKGLLSIAPDGVAVVLTTSADGQPFGLVDDVDVAPDGKIYFSDASSRFGLGQYRKDLLENRPYGRLLVFDPATGSTTVLLGDLAFANGVAVAPDGSFVLVNETWRYRVVRYWLAGPGTGQSEILVDNLPGFPDGISTGSDGVFWIALASLRKPIVDFTSSRPWARRAVIRLPEWVQPAVDRYGYVVGVNDRGGIVANLQDPDGGYAPITSVEEWRGMLYLGSLSESAFATLTL